MKQGQLNALIRSHDKWRRGLKGEALDIKNANLTRLMMLRANLTAACLTEVALDEMLIQDTNLSNGSFRFCTFYGTTLERADFVNADLYGADFSTAIFKEVNMEGADITDAVLPEQERGRKGIILDKPIEGYKVLANNNICHLLIPKGAVVFCINGDKCRTNVAKVLEGEGPSAYDPHFLYVKGKTLRIPNFDLRYNHECGTGIHFFKTLEEAQNY